MKLPLLIALISLLAGACTSGERQVAQPSATNAAVLTALYGKSQGDSAVFNGSKLIGTSNPDVPTIAKVIAKQVFQRGDSTLCLALTTNVFDGAGAQSGWFDAVLLHQGAGGEWTKLKEKRQVLPGGSFGTCDCQVQIKLVRSQGEKHYYAFARTSTVHHGEYEFWSALDENLVAQQNPFMTLELGNSPCPDPDTNLDTLKTGVFVQAVDNRNDRVQVVAYEGEMRDGKCVSGYRRRTFTYSQLQAELRRPRQEVE